MKIFAMVLLLSTSSCAFLKNMMGIYTPMNDTEIQDLTTCEVPSLELIRKNLMLAGYDVAPLLPKDDTLQTSFKQVEGYGSSKQFEKINVLKLDKNKIRFVVKLRTESIDKVETGSASIGTYKSTQSELVHNTQEADEKYYIEFREQYTARKQRVCGG